MANELREITDLCPIFDVKTKQEFEQALPGQLFEILPRPPETKDWSEADWALWYYGKVFADDGVRFTLGLVDRECTGPLPTTVERDDFAIECVDAAAAAGVSAIDLFATADYLSGVQNIAPRGSSAAGPFLFVEKSWAITIADATDLGLSASDRMSPYKQPHAAAAEAADTKEKFRAASVPEPGAAEHVFVRLFGRDSIGVLIRAGQPGAQDPSIEDVIASYCTGKLQGSVAANAFVGEISAAYPDLLGPTTARRKVSQVREALRTGLQPLVQRAHTLIAPLQPPKPESQPVPDPVADNLKLDQNEEFRDEILAAATKCGMDPAGLAALIDAEAAKLPSGLWNRDSTNPKSTAVGLTQFLKGTWTQMAKMSWTTLHEVAVARGITDAGALLDLRRDPALSIMSAAEYAASNLKFVMNKNPNYPAFYDPRTPDGKMRLAYLCHHEGPGGALTYLRGGKAQSYVEFLDSYIGKKIVPSRFRHDPARVTTGGVGDAHSGGGGGSTGSGPASMPTDVISVPPGNPIAFAELQDTQDQWHWPLITGETRAMTVSYRTGSNTVVGKPSREFLANRQGGKRYHVGMDIFCHQGDIVLAVADGEIVNFYPFYEGTSALFVKHGGVVINYGEVAPNSDGEFRWKKNDRVRAGQPIARVGRLNMIHLETYRPGTTQNARWMQDGSTAPSSLLNPTKLLLGLAARGTRKL